MKLFSLRRGSKRITTAKKEAIDDLSPTPVCSSIDPDSIHEPPPITISPSISLGIGQVSKHGIVFTPRFCFEEEISATASEQSEDSAEQQRFRVRDVASDEWLPVEAALTMRLFEHSQDVIFNDEMWTPDSKTAKLLQPNDEQDRSCWRHCTFDPSNMQYPLQHHHQHDSSTTTTHDDDDILVWSGTFPKNAYGSEIPAIRSAAVISMNALALTELLMDSSRVKTYNALSLGRTDNLVLNDAIGMVTKVMTSETRVLRKTIAFTSLLHVRQATDGSFHLVTRASHDRESSTQNSSEILLGINRIVPLSRDGTYITLCAPDLVSHTNRTACLMINVNHVKSPLVPMMIAKRIGLQAAINFIHDLRKVASQQ